jgi:hypothetical protein
MSFFKRGRRFADELSTLSIIAKGFIQPLLKHTPEQMSEQTHLERLFNVDYRTTDILHARAKFKMPGLYLVVPNAKFQGMGYRMVNPGTLCLVRKDSRYPNQIEVSFHGGSGDKEHVFELTESQWDSIRTHLHSEPA